MWHAISALRPFDCCGISIFDCQKRCKIPLWSANEVVVCIVAPGREEGEEGAVEQQRGGEGGGAQQCSSRLGMQNPWRII